MFSARCQHWSSLKVYLKGFLTETISNQLTKAQILRDLTQLRLHPTNKQDLAEATEMAVTTTITMGTATRCQVQTLMVVGLLYRSSNVEAVIYSSNVMIADRLQAEMAGINRETRD